MKTLDADKFLSQFPDEGGTVTMSKMHEAIKAATVELEVCMLCLGRGRIGHRDCDSCGGSGLVEKST